MKSQGNPLDRHRFCMLAGEHAGRAVLAAVLWACLSGSSGAQNAPDRSPPRVSTQPRQAPPPRRPAAIQGSGTEQAQAPGSQPGAAREPQAVAIRSPFQLNPAEQQALDEVLARWENQSQKINMLTCRFTRWEYDLVFNKTTQRDGELKYRRPDKGLYRVEGDPNDKTQPWAEHWVCDGQAIWEYKYDQKELVRRQLPPHLQGQAIEDGPLPFLFNTQAAKLKHRYFLRLTPSPPPADPQGEREIWLEAFPRQQQDAANFRKADLILRERDMLPIALQLHLPNGQSRTVHRFHEDSLRVNNPISIVNGDFSAPKTPRGWTFREEVVEQAAGAVAERPGLPQQAAAPPERPAAPTRSPAAPR